MCDLLTTGVVGILWGIYWWWNSYEKPSLHPTITEEERTYIESSIGEVPQPFGKVCVLRCLCL